MKRKIRSVLRSVGYDIRKVPRIQKDNPNWSKGYIIEFIGPSGVGKTTLYNSLIDRYKNDWYTRDQVRQAVEMHPRATDNLGEELEQVYSMLIKDKTINIFKQEDQLSRKSYLLQFTFGEMKLDILAKSGMLNKGLFSDDGITHNFGSEFINYHSSLKDKKTIVIRKGLEEFFRHRGIILITASPDFIKRNLIKRNQELESKGRDDALNNYYRIIGEEGLDKHHSEVIKKKEKMIEIAEIYGGKVLKINVEDASQEIISKRVDEFILGIEKQQN